jgi:hypothetical protein
LLGDYKGLTIPKILVSDLGIERGLHGFPQYLKENTLSRPQPFSSE